MEKIIIKVLNMSVAAGCMTLVIAALRLAFRRVPRKLFLVLWGLVALRLICPFTLQTSFSLVPDTGTILNRTSASESGAQLDEAQKRTEAMAKTGTSAEAAPGAYDDLATATGWQGQQNMQTENVQGQNDIQPGSAENTAAPGGDPQQDQVLPGQPGSVSGQQNMQTENGQGQNDLQPGNAEKTAAPGGDPQQGQVFSGQPGGTPIQYAQNAASSETAAVKEQARGKWLNITALIWLAGMVAMLLYGVVNDWRIRRVVREAVRQKDNVWRCDRIGTPFIQGILRPRIYLPAALAEPDLSYVLAHEQTHLRRRDHVWKAFGFALLAVNWFNPLIWLAFVLFCRDVEFACDESVLQKMGSGIKKSYADALINCSVRHRALAASPLAFAEANVKSRVSNVLRYKKAPAWMAILAVMLCLVLAGCFMTDPQNGGSTGSAAPETREAAPTEKEQDTEPAKEQPSSQLSTEQAAEPSTEQAAETSKEQPTPAVEAPKIYTGDYYTVVWGRGTEEEQAFAMDPQGTLIMDLAIPEKLTDAVTGELRYYTLKQYEKGEKGQLTLVKSWLYDVNGVPVDESEDCEFGACIGGLVRKSLYSAFVRREGEGEWPGYPGGEVPDPQKSTWLYDPITKTNVREGVYEIRKLNDESAVLLDPEGRLIGASDTTGAMTATYDSDVPLGSILIEGGFISGLSEEENGLEHRVILDSSLSVVAEAAESEELDLVGCAQGAVCIRRTQDDTELYAAEGWQLLARLPEDLRQTDGVCAVCGTSGNAALYDLNGTQLAGPYDEISLLKLEDGSYAGEYLSRQGETLTVLDKNGRELCSTTVEGLIYAAPANYGKDARTDGRIDCSYEWKDTDGTMRMSQVIYDRQLNRLTSRHFEFLTPVTEGIWLGRWINVSKPYACLLNEKEEEILYEVDDVFGGDENVIAVRQGYYVGLVDHQGNWIAKKELPVEKDLSEKLRLCILDFCETMYGSMVKGSATTFGWDDFRTVHGYAVAKNIETMRDTYQIDGKTGITEAEINWVRLEGEPKLQDGDYVVEARVSCAYRFDGVTSDRGSLYRFTIAEENGAYRVADLTELDNVEFTDLLDYLPALKEECRDAGDKWEFAAVDRIMEKAKQGY